MQTSIASFESNLVAAGFESIDLRPDNKIKRSYIKVDRRGIKNGWYVLNANSFNYWGGYGSHKTGERHCWSAPNDGILSLPRSVPSQKRAMPSVETIWGKAGGPDPKHQYLVKKKVDGKGLRQLNRQLLVPYRNIDGILVAVGTIKPDGQKRFISGSVLSGAFMLLGEISDRVFICEGYATGASIYQALQTATVISGSAGNLSPVATQIRKKFSTLEMIFMADDDQDSEINHGVKAAEKAAELVGGTVVYPGDFFVGGVYE
jgi:putative DNA primase/helicase